MAIGVFLAEDEFLIRQNIAENIDWINEGFEFMGAAADGELALPQILEKKPDILISDIKMPFLDGLKLSELVKKQLPNIKIVFLTGYKDFNLAKAAIDVGVTNYLLKPITTEKLISQLQDLAWQIEDEKKNTKLLNAYKAGKSERKKIAKNLFLSKLMISNRFSYTQILEIGNELGIDFVGTRYAVIILSFSYEINTIETEQKINEIEQNLPLPEKWLKFDRNIEGIGILCVDFNEEEWPVIHDNLCSYFDKNEGLFYFGAVGSVTNRLTEISTSYKDAVKACATRFFFTKERVLGKYDVLQEKKNKQDKIQLFQLDSNKIDRTIFDRFLKLGQKSEASNFTKEYLEKFDKHFLDSLELRHYLIMDNYFCCIEYLSNIGFEKQQLEVLDTLRIKGYECDNIQQCLTDLLIKTLELRDSISHTTHSSLIDKTKHFIKDNYNNKNMTLNYAADVLGISANYLSTVFSNETNQTFIEYLTNVKIEKAMDLLISTNMRSSEIAIEIGYQDPHYFSHVFKKYTGVSPREYRGGHSGEKIL